MLTVEIGYTDGTSDHRASNSPDALRDAAEDLLNLAKAQQRNVAAPGTDNGIARINLTWEA